MEENSFMGLLTKTPKRKTTNSNNQTTGSELDKIIDFSKVTSQLSLRRRLCQLIYETKLNLILDSLNCFLSLTVSIQTIWSTYSPEIYEVELWAIVNILIHVYYILEYSLRIYVAKDRKLQFYSKESLIELVSTLPYFLYKITQVHDIIEYNNDQLLRIIKLIDLLRLLKLNGLMKYLETDINKQFGNIVIKLIVLILFASQFVYVADKAYYDDLEPDLQSEKRKNLQYHFYIFFIITTISTVGYENPFQQPLCKVLVICIIITSFLIIPTASSELINLLSFKSLYARRRYKIVENIHHIIVTGTVSEVAASDFFQELFHEDHGGQQKHAVVLMPMRPDSYMENLLRTEDYGPNVFYIQGDPLDEKDLKRCQAEKAKAIVVLCNKQSGDANEEDAKTILQAMVIKKYLNNRISELSKQNKQNQTFQKPRLCMQLLRPEGKDHYYLSLNKETENDQVVCVEELKLSLLAKSCLCPGLVSVISNLITSSGEPPKRSELENCEWLEEYWKGKQFEIYKTQLSSRFVGKSFSWIAANIYRNFKAILFAIEIDTGTRSLIFNNPGSYIIPQNYRVTGYIISEDKSVADQISNYKISGDENEHKKKLPPLQQFVKSSFTSEKIQKIFTTKKEQVETVEAKDNEWNEKQYNPLAGEFNRIEEKCHTAPQKILLSDVTYTSIENGRIQNHIILCGLVPNLLKFVEPLRAKYLVKYPAIVMLHTEPPNEKQWNQISSFSDLYFIKGSAMFAKDLIAANIRKASTVVILSPESEELDGYRKENLQDLYFQNEKQSTQRKTRKLTRDEEDLLDAKTIFKYKAVLKLRDEVKRKEKREIQIVTELVSPQNLAFLLVSAKDYSIMRKFGYQQAYYNSALIIVLNQLIVGNIDSPQSMKEHDEFAEVKQSNLYQMSVPEAFINQPFEKLFNYLTKRQDILPIGLYRAPTSKYNKFPYVITNPDPQTILNQNDLIFILSQQMPSSQCIKWGTPLEAQPINNKKVLSRIAGMTLNDELMLNYDEDDKEIEKQNEMARENEQIFNKITNIVNSIKQLKTDIMKLTEELFFRQTKIHDKLRKAIVTELSTLVTQPTQHISSNNNHNHNHHNNQFHQEDLTSSSASSQAESSRSQLLYNQTTTTQ